MRIALLPFAALAVPLTVALVSAVGCNAAGDATFRTERSKEVEPEAPEDTVGAPNDASATVASPYRGSPLCSVTATTCMPDDDGTRPSYGGPACAERVQDRDAGAGEDAGATLVDSSVANGCRLTYADETKTLAPTCHRGGADRRGVDGVACATGAECAPGFDCVEGEKGGVCRRYCCAGSCESVAAQNGGPTFCDVQKLVDANRAPAPVCMPLKKCKLLTESECTANETCAVVTEQGDTGCVPSGSRGENETCEADHCKAGFTCLGSIGDRFCYRLCRTARPDCGPGKTCTTGAVFEDTSYGVCR